MNRTFIILAVIVVVLAVIIYFIWIRKTQSNKGDYFISTQTQSNQRIDKLGLNLPSDNASYILDRSRIEIFSDSDNPIHTKNYKADSSQEWVMEIQTQSGRSFTVNELKIIFDTNWHTNYQCGTVYGYIASDKRWTYALAADSVTRFEKLQLGVSLLGVYNDDVPYFAKSKLTYYYNGLKKSFQKTDVNITPLETIDHALNKAKELVTLYHQFNLAATIVLTSDSAYSGLKAWDALQSVGLMWGDGDIFHWPNGNPDFGDDQLFSVWTTTYPGYFLPEKIKDGKMDPENLVFGFSIPRNADPINVFEVMINAVEYCQGKLGGRILNSKGELLNVEQERQALKKIVESMQNAGIQPGSHEALTIF
jgi:cell division protein ZipA